MGQPDVPDAGAVSAQQAQYNQQAATGQNKTNSYNQVNPLGSQSYVADPNSPSGYTLTTSLSPNLQSLFNSQTGTAANAAQNSAGMYSQPYDLNAATGATAGLLNDWSERYVSPIFKQQQSNKDAELYNQGLAPGSTAWDNAQNLLARNRGDVRTQYLTQNEGQAFNQALQQYQLPLQTIAGLKGTTPGSPTFGATPTAQIQPPNYQQAVQNQYNAEQQQYQNMISGVGQIAGIAAAPFTGGLSLGMAGMFGGGNGLGGNLSQGLGGGWG